MIRINVGTVNCLYSKRYINMLKAVKRPRGRPREYDADVALARAAECFWKHGYAGTSLDALASATGMNRPSLYAAFGNKHELYLKTLKRYRDSMREAARALLVDEPSLRIYLTRFYRVALDVYFAGADGARGCYFVGTAATESAVDPAVRGFLADSIQGTDAFFATLVRKAIDLSEIHTKADPEALARLLTATLHTLAVRSRAGQSRRELEKLYAATIQIVCR
jgi:TetR/AcrR family transcriptional regulator, copper-responsive repressor